MGGVEGIAQYTFFESYFALRGGNAPAVWPSASAAPILRGEREAEVTTMSMVVAHVQKFGKADVHGMEVHNERSTERSKNKDIDREKTHLNYDLAAEQREGKTYVQAVKERVKSAAESGQKIRKDAVHLCSVVVSSDRDFFAQLQPEEQKKFFQTAKDALEKQFGSQNTIAAAVHVDEKTPHMHFQFVPIDKDGKLRAKSVVDRVALRKIQDELPRELQKAGFKIERGISHEEKIKHVDTYEWKAQELAKKEIELDQREKVLVGKEKQLNELLANANIACKTVEEVQDVVGRAKPATGFLGIKENLKITVDEFAFKQMAEAASAGAAAIANQRKMEKLIEENTRKLRDEVNARHEAQGKYEELKKTFDLQAAQLKRVNGLLADPQIQKRIEMLQNPHYAEFERCKEQKMKPNDIMRHLIDKGIERSHVVDAFVHAGFAREDTKNAYASTITQIENERRVAAQQQAAAERTAKAQEWARYLEKNPHVKRFLALRENNMSDKDAVKVLLMSGVDKKSIVSTIMAHSKNAPGRSDQARTYATGVVSKAEKELPKGAIPITQEKPSQSRGSGAGGGSQAPAQPHQTPGAFPIQTDGKNVSLTARSSEEEIDWAALSPEEAQQKIAEIEVKKDTHEMSR